MHTQSKEVIFVGIPGPTHNYGGLAKDNVASNLNRGSTSNPKQAALQALELVRLLQSLGITAGVLPPQLRPHVPYLRNYFSGSDDAIIAEAAQRDPQLLEKMSSSSAMWTANAATVIAGRDAIDGILHLTTANLHSNLHRRIEAADTHRVLTSMFAQVPNCHVHPPLDSSKGLRDEGAANHMRLTPNHNTPGLNVFIYGTDDSPGDPQTARQSLTASMQVAHQSGLEGGSAIFIKQHPAVIEEGVFHNDVIAVSNGHVLLAHEKAYANGTADIEKISAAYEARCGGKLIPIIIRDADLAVDEAVYTYFFNSQIISKPDGMMAIIAPTEVKDLYAAKAARLMENIRADSGNPVSEIHYADLRQSMNNGGGPACLRLRVPMDEAQIDALARNVNVLANDALLKNIEALIEAHYPEALEPQEIADPVLYHRCRALLSELGDLLKLPLL